LAGHGSPYGIAGDIEEFVWGEYSETNWLLMVGTIIFLYFFPLEGFTGTTVGKRILKMKVVREDGSPCTPASSLVRNALRFVDFFPYLLPYALGAWWIYWSPKKQRIGDRAAHTVVIKALSHSSTDKIPA
jgi:uncharacterized RDD family membrane protein YckC